MSACKLSVNINKIATLRNSRGGNNPDLVKTALDCERFGAQGITVHPRPDERHIRYQDTFDLKAKIATEFNIEGNCEEQKFVDLVLANKPAQVTLVPDVLGQITSNHGWDTIKNEKLLIEAISKLKAKGIRVSLFIDADNEMIAGAKRVGADRIEFYTGPFAAAFEENKEKAVEEIKAAAIYCNEIGIGINAGHDLNLDNLKFLKDNIDNLLEVSIGQAFVRDCLYFGLENTVHLYKRLLI